MLEEWKDIVIEKGGVMYDFIGKYQVSNMGRVRTLNYKRTGQMKIMKLQKSNNGYLTVGLTKNGKLITFLVHRLVGTMFILNDDETKKEINHIDENKFNNHVSNLEWVTPKQNINHGTRGQRAGEKHKGIICVSRKVVCIETKQVFSTIKEAEKWAGITGGITLHCQGKTKYAGKHPITGEKLHWMYYDEWLAMANLNN